MALDIVLSEAGEAGRTVRLGPFREARLSHRRMRAEDLEIVRLFDGAWHWGPRRFIASRLETVGSASGRLMHVRFQRPWGSIELGRLTDAARLYSDRLIIGSQEEWFATDDDDVRCWVSEGSGLAHEEIVIAA